MGACLNEPFWGGGGGGVIGAGVPGRVLTFNFYKQSFYKDKSGF